MARSKSISDEALLDASRCGKLQQPRGCLSLDTKGVRHVPGQVDERAGSCFDHLIANKERECPFDNVDCLILAMMQMQWCCTPWR